MLTSGAQIPDKLPQHRSGVYQPILKRDGIGACLAEVGGAFQGDSRLGFVSNLMADTQNRRGGIEQPAHTAGEWRVEPVFTCAATTCVPRLQARCLAED
jgi:hypothetical protein